MLVEGWNVGWDGDWLATGTRMDFTTPTADFDLEGVAAYARERGTRLVGHHETSGNGPHYEAEMDAAYALMARLGVRSVKTGYVDFSMNYPATDAPGAADTTLRVELRPGLRPPLPADGRGGGSAPNRAQRPRVGQGHRAPADLPQPDDARGRARARSTTRPAAAATAPTTSRRRRSCSRGCWPARWTSRPASSIWTPRARAPTTSRRRSRASSRSTSSCTARSRWRPTCRRTTRPTSTPSGSSRTCPSTGPRRACWRPRSATSSP